MLEQCLFKFDFHCVFPCSSQQPATLRLRGGSRRNEGRLEIFHRGRWGTICGSYFYDEAATVACRQLGFGSAVGTYRHAPFGRGTGYIWMQNVACRGNEGTLFDCDYRLNERPENEFYTSCRHSDDASLTCRVPRSNQRVGTGNLYFDTLAAFNRLCHDLWYAYCLWYVLCVLIEPLNCTWPDKTDWLIELRHDSGTLVCYHVHFGIIPLTQVRLVGGSSESNGLVQIRHRGQWGILCKTRLGQWTMKEAAVACRDLDLGFATAHLLQFPQPAGIPQIGITHWIAGVSLSEVSSVLSSFKLPLCADRTCWKHFSPWWRLRFYTEESIADQPYWVLEFSGLIVQAWLGYWFIGS